MNCSESFVDALKNYDVDILKQIPKADLHNHFVLGGSRKYIKDKTGFDIIPISHPLCSMIEMHKWSRENIGSRFDSKEMRKLLIEATLIQAKNDGVSILEIGEDEWGLGEYFNNDVDELVSAFQTAKNQLAPTIELRLQIG